MELKDIASKYEDNNDKILNLDDIIKEINNLNFNYYKINENISNEVKNFPIVKLVDGLIYNAINTNTSDIHIEPMSNKTRIRYRIDGELSEVASIPISSHQLVVGRIKILAHMDISEKRIPQDGRVIFNNHYGFVDLRVSSMPTVYGEKIVIRILKKSTTDIKRKELGFSEKDEKIIDRLISTQGGLILVAGPTGSGKTTTLYSILKDLNKNIKNIITIEDPVEYMIDGLNQINVNTKIGLDFSQVLRSVLRQDPDVIMIGEIRDQETAKIAVRAAITGHLVLSTIHTIDAPSTIIRLIEMGVEPYLVASSIKGVIAQRLVKKICPKCKTEYKADMLQQKIIDESKKHYLYKGSGCEHCQYTGYKGRVGIFEVLEITREHREAIVSNQNIDNFRDLCINKDMNNLQESCKIMLLNGITTLEEYIKLVMTND
ncbi:MAG: GspE/PulE family protein [Clostridiales bacterium]|nr:GspE/PulE family protein [Clostridiales bacterium]